MKPITLVKLPYQEMKNRQKNSLTGVSIIICCFNSAKRLPETFRYIAGQKVSNALEWEVIVINNNSTDTTIQTARDVWLNLDSPAQLNIYEETKPGLTFARERGMQVAKYDTLIWCDDDNWLCDTYVQTAFDIMNTHPSIGALGGWCEATFESEKPEWFDAQAKYFAVSKQGRRSGDITLKKGCVYGAGMVLRKSHWFELRNLGFKHLLSDRVGNNLSSGGDTEYCYALRLLGYKIWFDERLFFKHYMTNGRLQLSYVKRIQKAMAHSNFILWPYLDLLQGKKQTRVNFLKKAFKGFPIIFIKKMGALLFGSFEQRAVAKRYFTYLHYRLFKYDIYVNHFNFLRAWCPDVVSGNLKKD